MSEEKMMGLTIVAGLLAIVQWVLILCSIVVIFAFKDYRMTVWITAAVFTLCNFLFSRWAKGQAKEEINAAMRD